MSVDNLHHQEHINSLLKQAYVGRTSDLRHSIELAQQALHLSKKINDKPLIGKSLNQLSLYHMIISDFEASNKYSEEAITCFNSIGDDRGVADAKYNIGSVLYKSDNYHGGLIYLLEALTIYKKHNDLPNRAKVEKAVGTIYEYIGDEENAFKTYKSAIKTAREIGNTNLESNVFNNLSGLVLKRNKPTIAMRMITHSMALKKKTNDIRGYGFAIYGRGKIYLRAKAYVKAENDFLEALTIHEDVKENLGASMALYKLGELYYEQKDYKKAEKIVKCGLEITERFNISMVKVKNYHLLYLICKGAENTIESLKYLEFYLQEKEAVMTFQTLKIIENYELINRMNNLEHQAKIQIEKQKAIDKKNKDEEKTLKQKQAFLSIMSHEIRTPLNAITTIVSLLKNKLKGENKELFDSLHFASNNLLIILNDILDFTKLDSNKSVLEENNINFNALCNNIINLHKNNAENKGLVLELNSEIPTKQHYLLDQPKMAQILGNLISNAIKFTAKGAVIFNASLVREGTTHDTIKFSIKDTGEGISKENLDIIFDSFSQVKPVTTREQGGTGLGLAIVKKLVSLYGADIKVKSTLNQGSEFYFEIQLKKVQKRKVPEIKDSGELHGKIALVAEDTPINAMLIKKVLSNWGITSNHVKDGQQAFDASKEKQYDFILMDVHMPILNGLEATRLIKTRPNKNKNTPIFAVTADVLTNENEDSEGLFEAIILKPLEIDKLFLTLTRNLAKDAKPRALAIQCQNIDS